MICQWVRCDEVASIESLLQEWEKVAPKATDEVAGFVPMYGTVPFCDIKRRNLTTRFAGASPILGEALQRHCEHTYKHQFINQFISYTSILTNNKEG